VTDPRDLWRALDAPFHPGPDWQPIPGTCSRCGQAAALGTRRWWHLGPACRARRADHLTAPRSAEFIPDPTR
jgi:hypothetical protein